MLFKWYRKFRHLLEPIAKKAYIQLLLWLGLVIYAVLFYSFYKEYGLRIIGWHSHLLLPVYVFLLGSTLIELLHHIKLIKDRARFVENWTYIVWLYLFAESFILLTGAGKVRAEDINGYYMAPYETIENNYYHILNACRSYELKTTEYFYHRNSNSFGHADYEWNVKKDSGTIRILCLGDSFTEGDGAPHDSSYVAHLRGLMLNSYPKIEILNGGIRGSDPFFNYMNLKDRLLCYQPDIVIQSISSNDIFYDYRQRGGLERFGIDGQLKYNAPFWEPLYAASYVFRIFVRAAGYNPDLTKTQWAENEMQHVQDSNNDLFAGEYLELAKDHNLHLLLIGLPMREEIKKEQYAFDWEAFERNLKEASINVLDLMPMYKKKIEAGKFKEEDLYWEQDMHHNGIGYKVMAECIHEELTPLLDSLINRTVYFNGEHVN
jgi:lysophospholipase L1-like esterase